MTVSAPATGPGYDKTWFDVERKQMVLAGTVQGLAFAGEGELLAAAAVDREGGGRVVVSLAADTIKEYEQATAAWLERVRGRCAQVGAAYVRILADDDLETSLLGAWRREGVLRCPAAPSNR